MKDIPLNGGLRFREKREGSLKFIKEEI